MKKRIKTYKLKLYEVEVLYLYDILTNLKKNRMALTESKLKYIIDHNKEFRVWDDVVKESK